MRSDDRITKPRVNRRISEVALDFEGGRERDLDRIEISFSLVLASFDVEDTIVHTFGIHVDIYEKKMISTRKQPSLHSVDFIDPPIVGKVNSSRLI